MSDINDLKAGSSYLVTTHFGVVNVEADKRLYEIDWNCPIDWAIVISISYIDSDYIIEGGGEGLTYFVINIESFKLTE
jgi:hypothetical protein